jgi:predicted HTH domain antitoxin
MSNIQVAFPQELAFTLKMKDEELAREMFRLSMVKLYELGKISSGMAAKYLGCSRIAFMELAAEYKVSIFGNPSIEQLKEDLENA